ncbi:hypothetical protein FB451DRAFT_1486354 [Mycena latifolia]|nr:hypothetical protein FB451DRAFT_1486354 [Mycena latifolia]
MSLVYLKTLLSSTFVRILRQLLLARWTHQSVLDVEAGVTVADGDGESPISRCYPSIDTSFAVKQAPKDAAVDVEATVKVVDGNGGDSEVFCSIAYPLTSRAPGKDVLDNVPAAKFSIPVISVFSPDGEDTTDGAKPTPKVEERRPLGDVTNRISPRVHGRTTRARSSAFRKPNPREVQELEDYKKQRAKATLKVPRLAGGNPTFTSKLTDKPAVSTPSPPSAPVGLRGPLPFAAPVVAPASPEWHHLKAQLLKDARAHNQIILEKAATADRRRSLPITVAAKIVRPSQTRRASMPADLGTKRLSLAARVLRAFSWAPADNSGVPADLEAQADSGAAAPGVSEELQWSEIINLDEYLV